MSEALQVLPNWANVLPSPLVEDLRNYGGLSGAIFWRIACDDRCYCLRRWPREHPSADRLLTIHRFMAHLGDGGIAAIATPCKTKRGETFVRHDGHLWELAPWLPGEATRDTAHLPVLMTTLARVHQAAATFSPADCGTRSSPALARRLQIALQLRDGELQLLRAVAQKAELGRFERLCYELLAHVERHLPTVVDQVGAAAQRVVSVQWCLGDARAEHFLLTGDRVTGVVDFGAATCDSPASDVGRLVSDFVSSDPPAWQAAIGHYRQIRPFSDEVLRLANLFYSSGVVLAAANWVRWLAVDRQAPPDWSAVEARLEWIVERLEHLPTAGC